MRICFLTHNMNSDNGGGVFSSVLIGGISRALSHEYVVLTTVRSNARNEYPILCANILKLLLNFFRIRKFFKECDVIHALDIFPYGVIAAVASVGLQKKIILTAIGSGALVPLYDFRYSWLMRYTYRNAQSITAISNYTKNEILKKVPGLSISVIMPGVDYEFFKKSAGAVSTPNYKKFQPYILSVGSLRWRKGYKYSIALFAEIAKMFPSLHYIIVGKRYEEKEYHKLKNIISELNLEEKVHIFDSVEDQKELRDIYWGAELFCLMSQNKGHNIEGFGIVFLEAASAGLPVVGTADSGIEDAVLNGRNGILVHSRDFDGFAKAIIHILKNPALKTRMGEESLVFARTFGWPAKIDEYVKVYKNLV